jgi:hypothetical protein
VNFINLAAFGIALISAVLLVVFTLRQRKSPSMFRDISAYTRLRHAVGLAVEDGTRMHVSIGSGSPVTPASAASLAALSALYDIGEETSVGDNPPLATTGDGALAILAQDSFSAAYDKAGVLETFDVNTARAAGLTPFSYAAATVPVIRDEKVSANIILGSFGPEAALITDASEREGLMTISATDNLTGQAALFASTPDALIGEELYAAGAYLEVGDMHAASLRVQDLLRWLIVLGLLAGAALKVLGIL